MPLLAGFLDEPDGLVGRPEGMRQKSPVDESRFVSRSLLVPRTAGGVPDHRDLKAVLDEIAHMPLDAQIADGACQNDLLDPVAAQLQDHVIGRRIIALMRARDDGFPVEQIGLVALGKVGSRSLEALERVGALSIEQSYLVCQVLERG